MAIGGVPTLMDMDWATINANQRAKNMNDFKAEFLMNIKQETMALKPKLTWDGSNLKYENPTDGSDNMLRAMTEEELWNRYTTAAKNRGIKTDLVYFENELKPVYQAMSTNSLSRQLQDLTNRGLDPKHFKRLYKDDANFKKSLDYTINNTTDPTIQEGFRMLRPSVESSIGIGQALGIVGAGGYGLSKLRKFQPTNKMGRFLKGVGPLGALVGGRMLAGAMGATEQQLDYADKALTYGMPAYYGLQMAGTSASGPKGKYIRDTIGDINTTKKQLVSRAKALGIKDASKSMSHNDLRKGISGKIDELGIKKSKKAFEGKNIKIDPVSQYTKDVVKTRKHGAPKLRKGFRPKLKGKAGLALSILYMLGGGELDKLFGTTPQLEPETDDNRQAFDWENYSIS